MRCLLILLCACLLALAGTQSQAAPARPAIEKVAERSWPRDYTVNGTRFSLYPPELDSWTNNQLQCRVVMAVKTPMMDDAGRSNEQFRHGVVWLKARTETDIQGRLVSLSDLTVTRVNFPGARNQEAQYQSLLQTATAGKSLVVSLDQLEAALAVAGSRRLAQQSVGNVPPEIIIASSRSVLVRVDGEPVWRAAGVAGIERAINTRALLLRYQGRYYLGYAGHWASSAAITSGWAATPVVPSPLLQVMRASEATNQIPDSKGIPPYLAQAFANGQFPAVYLRTRPAELIQAEGQPRLSEIAGTGLAYVSNSAADLFVDTSHDRNWYVLISGRWFTAPSNKGPWRYVAPSTLPRDFARIPADSSKAAVLASIPGTVQAHEALIANGIAQTAKVDRTMAIFQARYDGAPRFRPLVGTKNLAYAVNSAVPVIDVPHHSYYALNDGVWFLSEASAEGPWVVATSVPPDIYSIPPSSPLHYVTYVRVYGSSGRYVHVGYTPGYYGTVVSNDLVVYGTGYPCNGWIGRNWYGCPETYGYGAALAYGRAVGWGMGFGWGCDYPWYDPGWGPWRGNYPGYFPWAYGGAAAWNIYGRWGNSVLSGSRAAWANPWTGNNARAGAGGFYNPFSGSRGDGCAGGNPRSNPELDAAATNGKGNSRNPGDGRAGQGLRISASLYAGRDGNVYRADDVGGWQKLAADNRFVTSQPAAGLEAERSALERAYQREKALNAFQRSGGFGAIAVSGRPVAASGLNGAPGAGALREGRR